MLQAERDSAHELAALRDDWESLRREEAHELRVHLLQNVLPQPLKWDSLFSLCSGGVFRAAVSPVTCQRCCRSLVSSAVITLAQSVKHAMRDHHIIGTSCAMSSSANAALTMQMHVRVTYT